MKEEVKLLGYCAVDSGQLIIIDPGYLRAWKDGGYNPNKKADNHYAKACELTLSKNQGGQILVAGIAGTGVATATGYGDGCYPVYAYYNKEGKISKIEIEFLV